MPEDVIFLCCKCCVMFMFSTMYARHRLIRDKIIKELATCPIWLFSILTGYAMMMITCVSEIGSYLFSNSFGKFLGRFVFAPSGYLALAIAMGEHSDATILKMIYKILLLLIQIGLAIKEVYSGQDDIIAFNALGIGVTLAMFDIADTIKEYIPKAVEQKRKELYLIQKETYRKFHDRAGRNTQD